MLVGVVGAGGRMGRLVCRTVQEAGDLELAAAVDPSAVGQPAAPGSPIAISDGLAAMADAGVEAVVDFSHITVALATLEWCATRGVHVVMGTSGFGPGPLARAAELFPAGGGANCLVVSNFAISAVVAVRLAEMAAPWFDTAEVIELHHDGKVDAPSGTAMTTAERLGGARRAAGGSWPSDATTDEVLPQARGAEHASGVRIHSVRMRGMVAHEEIILGTTGQTLTIRQDSYDRESYMPGVLVALRGLARLDGLTVGLETLLGI